MRPASSVVVLSPDEQARMRSMYASGEYAQYELAEEFGVSKSTVQTVVQGMVRPILPHHSYTHHTDRTVPIPAGHQKKPVLWLSAMRGGWWPGVSRSCADCGGRLLLVPPLLTDGALSCLACSREPFEVLAR